MSSETITTRDELLRELERTRTRGFAINRGGWRIDVGGAAVCVRDANGAAVAALCVAVPLYRMTKRWVARIQPHLSAAARSIGSAIGPHESVSGVLDRSRRSA